jgi:hypothetical protein
VGTAHAADTAADLVTDVTNSRTHHCANDSRTIILPLTTPYRNADHHTDFGRSYKTTDRSAYPVCDDRRTADTVGEGQS